MKQHEFLAIFDREVALLRETLVKKGNDYSGGDEDTLANFKLAEKLDLASAETGLLLRLMDKVQRVKSFLKKGTLSVENESAQDAVRDMIGYSVALLALMEEKDPDYQDDVKMDEQFSKRVAEYSDAVRLKKLTTIGGSSISFVSPSLIPNNIPNNPKNMRQSGPILSRPEEKMKVKIKKLGPNAKLPTRAKPGDAGLDLVATSKDIQELNTEYGTSLAIEIPPNHVGLIFPRSSISNKLQMLSNSVGVIDSQFRGEIKFRFRDRFGATTKNTYDIGDKIGQLIIIPYPEIEFEEVDELSETNRGSAGFGSSGA